MTADTRTVQQQLKRKCHKSADMAVTLLAVMLDHIHLSCKMLVDVRIRRVHQFHLQRINTVLPSYTTDRQTFQSRDLRGDVDRQKSEQGTRGNPKETETNVGRILLGSEKRSWDSRGTEENCVACTRKCSYVAPARTEKLFSNRPRMFALILPAHIALLSVN